MKKLKEIFKSKKNNEQNHENEYNQNLDPEKSKKENTFYVIAFVVIMAAALILKFTENKEENKNDNNTNTPEEVSTNENKEFLSDIEKNNFDADLTIIADSDLLNLLIRRESLTKELISKTYRGENLVYYVNGDKVYKNLNGAFTIDTNSNIYNNYDTTFLNMSNIQDLIDNHTYEVDLKEENYNIKRYKIEASRVIDIYNKYNDTKVKRRVSGEVILDINYTEDELLGLKLDLTNLYENLEYDYRKVVYTYEFDNFGKIDIKSFMEVPAE